MTQLEIVVRGNAHGSFAPERAQLRLRVNLTGEQRDSVYRDAAHVHSSLVSAVEELVQRSVVATWSSESVHVYSHRPYDSDGAPRDPVYTANIGVEARFHDFDELDRFIDTWAVQEGVEIGGVSWELEPANRRRYEAELRKQAVEDAVVKAQAYADAVGRGAVTPTQLADPEMLSDSRPMARGMMLAAKADGGAGVELHADDIELSVAVDARFIAE